MTSSLFSPITGKRECVVSITSGMNSRGLVVARHDVHLRARDHDVAHRHLGHRQHALDHRQRVGVEQLALEAPCSSSSSSSRSSGSRVRNADRRSSSVGLASLAVVVDGQSRGVRRGRDGRDAA